MGSTTVITWPSVRTPAVFDWRLTNNDASFRGPFNNYVQDLGRPGAAFAFTVSWPVLDDDERIVMGVFLMRIKKAGYRTKPPVYAYTPRGVLTGVPLVNGAGQSGLTLATDGWTHTVTKIAALGDFVTLATGQLLRLTADANSDGGGAATLAFEPPLRAAPADNSAVTVADPRAVFKWATATEALPVTPGKFVAFSADFIEDID